jgi:hypothetical protein
MFHHWNKTDQLPPTPSQAFPAEDIGSQAFSGDIRGQAYPESIKTQIIKMAKSSRITHLIPSDASDYENEFTADEKDYLDFALTTAFGSFSQELNCRP